MRRPRLCQLAAYQHRMMLFKKRKVRKFWLIYSNTLGNLACHKNKKYAYVLLLLLSCSSVKRVPVRWERRTNGRAASLAHTIPLTIQPSTVFELVGRLARLALSMVKFLPANMFAPLHYAIDRNERFQSMKMFQADGHIRSCSERGSTPRMAF